MAGQSSQDVLQQTVDSFAQRIDDYAQGIANRLGQPLSGQQLTKDQAVQRWNFSPLGDTQTADAQYHQLVAQGVPPGQALSQVYPMRQLLIQGADIQDSIARAKQISGWAAEAAGEPPPKPREGSTLPQTLLQQTPQGAAAPSPAAPSGPMAPAPPLPAPPAGPQPAGPVPMQSGGVVTQPTVALIGEAGPEAVVPLTPSVQQSLQRIGQGASDPSAVAPQGTDIQQYIAQAAQARGIDPGTALAVAYNEGGLSDPANRGTFATGSSWWPFQLHYGGLGYSQYGSTAGLGNEFTAKTGYQPGDPAAWRASVDFALDTALQRGWYPTWYGSKPAGVSQWQGIPRSG